jgi:hypothetical protein
MLHEVSPPITSTMQGDIRDDSSRLNLTFVWEIEGTESERDGDSNGASDPHVPHKSSRDR